MYTKVSHKKKNQKQVEEPFLNTKKQTNQKTKKPK